MMKSDTVLCGLGRFAPEKILTNADLEKIVDTSDEWITTRTGIKERHIVGAGECCSDLAFNAAKKALEDAGMEADELTHIFVSTFSPDMMVPSTACIVEEKLGITGKATMDLAAACSGFIYGLETARAYLALHPEAKILVIGSEVCSSRTNWEDRTTCVLFGDGAGAAIVANRTDENQPGVIDVRLSSDGSLGSLLTTGGGGSASGFKLGGTVPEDYFIVMQGREIFKHAVRSMVGVCNQILEANGYTKDDVDVLIPHQANFRIIDAVGRKLEIPEEKVYINVDRFGNTSAASIPLALAEAVETGAVKKGDLVMLTSFGGGFTWASALIRF